MDLIELKRLYDMGFNLLWLRPKSKIPMEKHWTKGERDLWEVFKSKYKEGYNVGVKLGANSKLSDGTYLAAIDCDVKDPSYEKEMLETLTVIMNGDGKRIVVLSGRGNGSHHIYFKTKEPVKPYKFAQSKEKVKVHMPSVNPSKIELATLTKQEIKDGIRLRAPWEISIMGTGQQVVLPPSIHPDSGKPYLFSLHSERFDEIRILNLPERITDTIKEVKLTYEIVKVDLAVLPAHIQDLITDGEGCEDKSAGLFSATLSMIGHDFNDNQIISVLTNEEYYLGQTAYEHTKSKNLDTAAHWIFKYTIQKARAQFDASKDFEMAVDYEETAILSDEEATEQKEDLVGYTKNWSIRLQRAEKSGNIKPTYFNAFILLKYATENPKIFAHNSFSIRDYIVGENPFGGVVGRQLDDDTLLLIKKWAVFKYGVEFAINTIHEAVKSLLKENSFNPVVDYLDGLDWDGTPRLDTWMKRLLKAEAPEPYLSEVSRKVICAMVERAYRPGCKFDNVLILQGAQGVGKSTAAMLIAGEEWFSDTPLNIRDKDAVLGLRGNWVVELGELYAMRKADTELLKAFVSRKADDIRPPYGRTVIHYPRQSIFIGTTNQGEYLKDETGNRRYWPVEMGDVDFSGIKKERDQLFAEAKFMAELGEKLFLEKGESLRQAQAEQNMRMETDEIEEDIKTALEDKKDPIGDKFSVRELISKVVQTDLDWTKRADQQRVAKILRFLGYKKFHTRVGKRWKKGQK